MDDAALIDRARRGDERAFAALFDRHQRAVFRYSAAMAGHEAADDIVQDTFLAVLRQRDRRDRPTGSGVAYLIGIARHLALKRLAMRPGNEFVDVADDVIEAVAASGADTALEDLTRAETIEAIRAAVRSLPAPYREVVVLCEFEELDYATAAAAMSCPIGTVRSRLSRARALLVDKLRTLRQRGWKSP